MDSIRPLSCSTYLIKFSFFIITSSFIHYHHNQHGLHYHYDYHHGHQLLHHRTTTLLPPTTSPSLLFRKLHLIHSVFAQGSAASALVGCVYEDRLVKIWSLADHSCLQTLSAHRCHLGKARVSNLICRPDLGTLIISSAKFMV